MYNVNDLVLYSSYGVCKIADITEKDLYGEKVEYYVLKPVNDKKSTYFVPVNHAASVSKMRHTLTKDEVFDIIQNMPNEDTVWIENDARRKEKYKSVISECNPRELVRLIKSAYIHKQNLQEVGKKVHKVDEDFMKEAENLLYEEFAVVLKLDKDEVLPFITSQLKS